MSVAKHARPLLFLLAALIVSCTGDVAVKDVQGDKFGYLSKTFALQSIPGGTATAITARDPGPVGFRRMVLAVTPTFVQLTGAATPPQYRMKWTLISAGGPFVQYLEEQSSNGVSTRQDYGISYRNIQDVRAQSMVHSDTQSTWVMEMKSVEGFTPLATTGSGGGGDFNMNYSWGNPMQLANMTRLAVHCTYGERYPAAKINAKLAGEAQDLSCERMNQNGVVADHTTDTLLLRYGVTIRTRAQTPSDTVLFRFDEVTIE
ncbi:MAG: hypothetical protein JSR36_08870 [Proteobacteria bacterium]|nr:hypothetical protein [Pseudomonadota bacterium]